MKKIVSCNDQDMFFKTFSTSVRVDEINLFIVIFPSDGQLSNLSLDWVHEKQNRNNQSRKLLIGIPVKYLEAFLPNIGDEYLSNIWRHFCQLWGISGPYQMHTIGFRRNLHRHMIEEAEPSDGMLQERIGPLL